MVTQFRKSSDFLNFCIVAVVAILLMVADTRTKLLDGPRNVLSVILQPIQVIASLPSIIGRTLDSAIKAEPDVKIAYENLRNEYFRLKSEALLLRSLRDENRDLRHLLDASERLKEKITLAELVNVSIDPYNHRVLVGRGLIGGVYVGQAVIDDQGIIGQVTEVMPLNSSVMLITDPSHAMPVKVQRNGLRTILHGTGNCLCCVFLI